jgi:hypothetical protein
MELLFESRLEIATVSGKVYFFQGKPDVHPDPIVRGDTLVDGRSVGYVSVLKDGGRYRMWYYAAPSDTSTDVDGDLVAYAESENGPDWVKPKLNLVEYGSSPNNLCNLGFHSHSIFIDPEAPASHRYRATGFSGMGRLGTHTDATGGGGYYTAYSSDGLDWKLDSTSPRWRMWDVITSAYHPTQRRAIVCLKKMPPRVNKLYRRSIWSAELRGGEWSDEVCALVPDEFDDICATHHGYAFADYYGMGMMPAGKGTVGFLWQFRHDMPIQTNLVGAFGATDVTLVYQMGRGERWLHKPGRENFLTHGEPAWTQGGIYTAPSAVEVGDEQWMYFSGAPNSHCWQRLLTDGIADLQADAGYDAKAAPTYIGMARWPKDRIFGFRGDPCGHIDIYLGKIVQDSELFLNFRTAPQGKLTVELLHGNMYGPSEKGKAIAGYSSSEAIPLTGDHVAQAVVWKPGESRIASISGEEVVARIHIDDAEVYAYECRGV